MINKLKISFIIFTSAFAINLVAMDSESSSGDDVEQGHVDARDSFAMVRVNMTDSDVDYSANLLDISDYQDLKCLSDSCAGCELKDLDLIRLRMLAYSLDNGKAAPVLTTQAHDYLPFIRKSGFYYYYKKCLAPVSGIGGALLGAFLGQIHSYVTMYCLDHNLTIAACSARNNASLSVEGASLSFLFGAGTGIVLYAKFSKDFEENRNAAQDAVAEMRTAYDEMAKALLKNYLSNLIYIKINLDSGDVISDHPSIAELDGLYFSAFRSSFSSDFLPAKAGISFYEIDTVVKNVGAIELELANKTTVRTAASTMKKFKEAVKIIADDRKILLNLVFRASANERHVFLHKLNLLITDEDLMNIIEAKLLGI